MDLSDLRQEYADRPLDFEHIDSSPFRQFETWYKDATDAQLLEPNAMTLATVDAEGAPAQRTVPMWFCTRRRFFMNTTARPGSRWRKRGRMLPK